MLPYIAAPWILWEWDFSAFLMDHGNHGPVAPRRFERSKPHGPAGSTMITRGARK
jgi:hypothetical protein